ncbi:MAG: TIGR04282 family arsenosugar biosynthesis glycosyltransferase [Magnetococcales bacterium]|nr:TIGR04282 family arsenosugar biosynthesis glycosyltransferase [Magnetococcales bacterium]MBF0437605.1 TIGR04282 family arsenosugar biosynthesis glycosyltransferase [Magnetococcales bacterium]
MGVVEPKANCSINVLGRAPLPGFSKTRLIPALGAEGAAHAHVELLTHVAGVARSWSSELGSRRLFRLWGTPDLSSSLFQSLAEATQQRLQPTGDLGARLDWIARAGLAEARAVLLLGGDAVSVDRKTLDHAEAVLLDHPAVLIPADDGGYVLLGLNTYAPELFCDIPWGSDQVAEATRTVLRFLQWSWKEIPGHWDVDSPEDWERFHLQKSRWPDNCFV